MKRIKNARDRRRQDSSLPSLALVEREQADWSGVHHPGEHADEYELWRFMGVSLPESNDCRKRQGEEELVFVLAGRCVYAADHLEPMGWSMQG